VALRADGQLDVQFIPDFYAQRAKTILTANTLTPRGAALRRAVFIRSWQDLDIVKTISGKEKRIPKVAEGDIIIAQPGVYEQIDEIEDEALRKDMRDLFKQSIKLASGIVMAVEDRDDDYSVVIARGESEAIMLAKDSFDKLEDGGFYAFDFKRARVYDKKGVAFDREELIDNTAYASVDEDADPQKITITTIAMDDIYKELGIHPLALIVHEIERDNTHISQQQKEKINRMLTQQGILLEDREGIIRDVELILAKYHVKNTQELIYNILWHKFRKLGAQFFTTSGEDVRFFRKLAWGNKLEMESVNGPIDFRGLIKTISCGYDELFLMFLGALKQIRDKGINIGIQLHYINDANVLDFALEYLKAKDIFDSNLKLGMTIANCHNFIRAQDYFTPERKISFASFDDDLLIMNINLVDLENHVMLYTGEFVPLIERNDPELQEGLRRAKAIAKTAMVKHEISLAEVKASSPVAGSSPVTTALYHNNHKEALPAKQGLLKLKKLIFKNAQELIRRREKRALVVVIDGRPGTGKTTIAKALGQISIKHKGWKKTAVFKNITQNEKRFMRSASGNSDKFKAKFPNPRLVVLEDWLSLERVDNSIVDIKVLVTADIETRRLWLKKRGPRYFERYMKAGAYREEWEPFLYRVDILIDNSKDYALPLDKLNKLFKGRGDSSPVRNNLSSEENPSSSPIKVPEKIEISKTGVIDFAQYGKGGFTMHLFQDQLDRVVMVAPGEPSWHCNFSAFPGLFGIMLNNLRLALERESKGEKGHFDTEFRYIAGKYGKHSDALLAITGKKTSTSSPLEVSGKKVIVSEAFTYPEFVELMQKFLTYEEDPASSPVEAMRHIETEILFRRKNVDVEFDHCPPENAKEEFRNRNGAFARLLQQAEEDGKQVCVRHMGKVYMHTFL